MVRGVAGFQSKGLESPMKVRICPLVRSCSCPSPGQQRLAKMLESMGCGAAGLFQAQPQGFGSAELSSSQSARSQRRARKGCLRGENSPPES